MAQLQCHLTKPRFYCRLCTASVQLLGSPRSLNDLIVRRQYKHFPLNNRLDLFLVNKPTSFSDGSVDSRIDEKRS